MDDLDKEMKMTFIDEARQLLEAAEQCFLDLESSGGSPDVIENIFRLAHNMKGTSRAVGFGEVATFTHELESLLLKIKEGKLSVDKEIADLLLACNDHLKEMVDGLSIDLDSKFDSTDLIMRMKVKIEGRPRGGTPAEAPKEIPPEAMKTTHIPDFDLEEEAFSAPAPRPADLPMPGTPVAAKKTPAPPPQQQQQQVDESIRVSVARLEKLGDFIGELVILQTVLNQHRNEIQSQLVQRTVQQLGKLSKEIQDISMSLRMIPLKQTFAKLQRIVRDTSKALDKEVELVLYGDQTEVDKTVLEQVSDPLVHIVRNAIDHGLEMPEDREKIGKPREGRILIHAFHRGNNLVIEITDDGKGIDPKKLAQKSIERGLFPEGTELTDDEAINLIFHPGFSTKDQVSEISGRGVGLDVVKNNVEKLGGQVQLESDLGFGTCFRIVLPLTLAIIDAMVVQSGDERYVIPIATVHETVQPKKEDVNYVTGKGEMLNLRDQTLPLFRLSALLKIQGSKPQKEAWKGIAIIANNRKQPFAVLVDDILRQQQIVIKKLGAEIRVQKGLAGSAILGDGKPALIIDLIDLLEMALLTPTLRSPLSSPQQAA